MPPKRHPSSAGQKRNSLGSTKQRKPIAKPADASLGRKRKAEVVTDKSIGLPRSLKRQKGKLFLYYSPGVFLLLTLAHLRSRTPTSSKSCAYPVTGCICVRNQLLWRAWPRRLDKEVRNIAPGPQSKIGRRQCWNRPRGRWRSSLCCSDP